MEIGVALAGRVVLGMGEGSFLSENQMIGVIVASVLVVVLIVVSLVRRRSKAMSEPMVDSCPACGSMSMNRRAGLAVCMDCGASVNIAGAQAD
jgi:ribosomal protein L32